MLQEFRWCDGVVATDCERKSCVSKDAEDEDRRGVYFANPPTSLGCPHPYSGCGTVGESVTSIVEESAEILGDCTNRHDGDGFWSFAQ
jgi:hypothetical protein